MQLIKGYPGEVMALFADNVVFVAVSTEQKAQIMMLMRGVAAASRNIVYIDIEDGAVDEA